jgi:NAD(P)-dependent dehydrogenase (short-subunit alcohol dehydrogenase family)
MGLLDEKVAIITGAGRGIGRQTALLFAKEGARVVVNDVGASPDGTTSGDDSAARVVEEIEQAGGQALASNAQVSDSTAVQQLTEETLERFGRIDVLVNNAGILRDRTLLKMEDGEFDAVVQVHLRGTFVCLRAVAAHMKRAGSGSIINTTSVAGMLGNFGQANYSAATAGVHGLTRTASIELQRYGIRVNAIAPLAKTRLTEDLPMFHQVDSMRPEHVAPLHLFLASELSDQVTGMVLSVAGGRISTYRVVESAGQFKEANEGIWTAQEIADQLSTIKRT